jgi:hypothetical protein
MPIGARTEYPANASAARSPISRTNASTRFIVLHMAPEYSCSIEPASARGKCPRQVPSASADGGWAAGEMLLPGRQFNNGAV